MPWSEPSIRGSATCSCPEKKLEYRRLSSSVFSRYGRIVSKSSAGRASFQAAYDAEAWLDISATNSEGTLASRSCSRRVTRIRAASSESWGRPSS